MTRKKALATKEVVLRRYPHAVAESSADGHWKVYSAPVDIQPIRHTLGKGLTPAAAWADAAGRCMR